MATEGDSSVTSIAPPGIGRLIRLARQRRGLSQYQVADALASCSGNHCVDRNRVARWERGGRVPDPYWRHWLGLVLELPRGRLDQAARISYAQRDYYGRIRR